MTKTIYEMTLTEQMAELEKVSEQIYEINGAIRRKMYAEGFEEGRKAGRNELKKECNKDYEKGKFAQRMDTAFKEITKIAQNTDYNIGETAQEERDKIVERAKEDIKDLKLKMISIIANEEGSSIFRQKITEVEFVVNKEKRTIVALVKGEYDRQIIAKGIAKCDPNDCFNVYIGKAIALRRALGLDVPDEYIYAPQPTKVSEGDIVEIDENYSVIKVKDVKDRKIEVVKGFEESVIRNNTLRVTDDSREDE